jgi:hypothetical protein
VQVPEGGKPGCTRTGLRCLRRHPLRRCLEPARAKGQHSARARLLQFPLPRLVHQLPRGLVCRWGGHQATPVSGALDRQTQRVAWTIQDQPETVYETGLYNLTQDETSMLVHFGKDSTEQYELFRIEQENETGAAPGN